MSQKIRASDPLSHINDPSKKKDSADFFLFYPRIVVHRDIRCTRDSEARSDADGIKITKGDELSLPSSARTKRMERLWPQDVEPRARARARALRPVIYFGNASQSIVAGGPSESVLTCARGQIVPLISRI